MYWTNPQILISSVGVYTSLELDLSGNPHIAYHDYFARDLCYAHRDSAGVWTLEVVDSSGDVGRFASLELSSAGMPSIAYLDFTNGQLKYAEKRTDGWHIESIAPFPCCGWYSSLALDSADMPHIAFTGCSEPDLYYAHRDSSGQWTTETVDSAGDVGLYSAIRLWQDMPRISYYDKTNGHLKFAEKEPDGTWSIEVVDYSPRCGIDTSLALDGQGRPHISYWDQQNGDLKYATRQNGIWTVETIDAEGYAGYESYISALGWPRISYEGARGLRYAERKEGCWRIYELEEDNSAAGYTSLAVDRFGNPRISYFRYLSRTVEYRVGTESTASDAPPVHSTTGIGDAARFPDGTWISLPRSILVSAGSLAGWHAEAPDRSAGIRLKAPLNCRMPSEGDEIELLGVIEKGANGERRIQVCEWKVLDRTKVLEPLFVSYQDPLAAGLLVRMTGTVRIDAGRLYLGDVEVEAAALTPPEDGSFIAATGVLRKTTAGYMLSPRRNEDIIVIQP